MSRTASLVGLLLALAAGALHAALSPAITIADLHPNLLVVAGVLAGSVVGAEMALLWAFAAGLAANLLLTEPLGTVPLGLLGVVVVVLVLRRLTRGHPWLAAVGAGLIGSLVADGVALASHLALGEPWPVGELGSALAMSSVINAGLVLLAFPITKVIDRRLVSAARGDW